MTSTTLGRNLGVVGRRHLNDFACTRYDEIERSGLTTKRHQLSFLV
jgi:hypothetical protein